MLTPGQRVAVGVSGGPDSVALLHLLVRMRPEYDLRLRAAHLHHGLRPEADGDAQFVVELAARWDVPCSVERVDVAALARRQRLSVEEAGRQARYAFFARVAPVAAVAHTADDQAETVLMHFLRGSGAAGLRGMLPRTDTVIRPLLSTTRSDIEAYLAAHDLPARLDPTNLDTAFYRNRLRHDLIPILATYNPKIRQVLTRTAEVMAGDYALLRDLVDRAWAEAIQAPGAPGVVSWDLDKWRALPLALQRALLREAVDRLRPGLRDLAYTPVERAARWAGDAESGHAADLVAGLCLKVAGRTLTVCAWDQARGMQVGRPDPVRLSVPGVARFLDWQATAEVLNRWSLADIRSNPDRWTAYLNASCGPFVLRTRRPGDRFQPLGMGGGTVKLSDYMVNRKMPLALRARWPLLGGGESGDLVLWVCGHHPADQARVTRATKQVVRVSLAPVENTGQ